MMRGEPARQACRQSILVTLSDNGEMEFEEIVASVDFSRGTVNKYLTEMFGEALVKRRGRRGAYYLTPKGGKIANAERLKNDIYDLTDSFDTKWLELLRRLLKNMRKQGTNPEEFFKHQCLAFVGGLPYNFEKSIEGMEYALRYERDLTTRGAKEGLTKEQYATRLAKRVDKQPTGFRKILALMGLEEEQIEACIRMEEAILKQGITDVYGRIKQEEELAFKTQLFRKISRAQQDLTWTMGEIHPIEKYRLNRRYSQIPRQKVFKVTWIHPRLPRADLAVMNDIWIEEGIL